MINPDPLLAENERLRALLSTFADHASETYPHFESERGQREITEARAALASKTTNKIVSDALDAASQDCAACGGLIRPGDLFCESCAERNDRHNE
jgi:hypothetical protein